MWSYWSAKAVHEDDQGAAAPLPRLELFSLESHPSPHALFFPSTSSCKGQQCFLGSAQGRFSLGFWGLNAVGPSRSVTLSPWC